MAREDYTGVPEVQAQLEAPNDYQRVDATPASFGGQAAEGLGDLGQGVMKASEFYGQVAADNGTNNTLQQVTSILHGDPNKTVMGPDGQPVPDTGYFGKRGADAMAARAETQQAIDEAIQENRESLSTPQARLQYDNETRRYRAQWLTQMGTHADDQQRVWAQDTNTTAATLALNQAARSPTDPTAVGDALQRTRNAYVKNAQLRGEDTAGAVLKADQDVAMARIRSLVVNDPKSAETVLDESKDVLGSRPDYDQISHGVKTAVINATLAPAIDQGVNDALAGVRGSVGQAPTGNPALKDISTAIGGQEWHGKGPAPTSVNGAIGPSQITPDTARRYGLDPAKLHDPTYAAQARDTIIAKISALPNVQGDPARIAVGYFSGDGNIAPAGSPTPFIHDAADGTGKKTSAYVADVMARLQKYPSTADALNANMDRIEEKAQGDAERLFPNYPDAQERYVQGVVRGVNRTISQQRQQYEVDTHVVQSVMAGPKPPISEDELMATSPQVAQAWNSMQINNPYAALSVERMFDANAKGKALTYGTGFKDYLDRVLAPSTNPDRITNSSQLWPYVGTGSDAPLTNTGANELGNLLGARNTPQGEAFASQAKGFIDQMHAQLTFSNKGTGVIDGAGEARFSRFMVQALPILEQAAKGGNLAHVLDPKSPDYLGKMAQTFARTPAQIMKDRLADVGAGNASAEPFTPETLTQTLDSLDNDAQRQETLRDAVARHRISLADATKIGIARGYIASSPNSPGLPAPTLQGITAPGGG